MKKNSHFEGMCDRRLMFKRNQGIEKKRKWNGGGEKETLRCSQVSAMVRGPCSLTMSKMVRLTVCICSGGIRGSIGFIFGFGFFAIHRATVANISSLTFPPSAQTEGSVAVLPEEVNQGLPTATVTRRSERF